MESLASSQPSESNSLVNPTAYDQPSSSSGLGTSSHFSGSVSTAISTTNNLITPGSSLSSDMLSYPYNFFDTNTGQGPKNEAEAANRWQYRKHRPAKGTVDTEPADGKKMMLEVREMRNRLKIHIMNAFMAGARKMAEVWKLKNPTTNQSPVTYADLLTALVALKQVEGSLESERIVYMACHHFHHQRKWLSNAVDAWCKEEKIKIEYPTVPQEENGVRKRASHSNRGGFGVYARNVKGAIVKRLMRNMLNQVGWAISVKDNSNQGKGKKYTAITIGLDFTGTNHTCFLVTKEDSGKQLGGASMAVTGSADNPIDVDDIILGFGAHVCSKHGITVTETELHGMLKDFRPQSDLVGRQIETKVNPEEQVSDITPTHDLQPAVKTPAAPADPDPVRTSSTAAHTASNFILLAHLLMETAAPFQFG